MSLDDFARRLAEPMPRRRALGIAGGALASFTLGGLVPRRARAQGGECLPGHSPCITSPNLVCCNTATEDCAPDALHICRTKPTPCPAGKTHCGSKYDFQCCDSGWTCQNGGQCIPPCPPGTSKCGSTCCGRTQECRGGRCVRKCPNGGTRCGSRCCPKGRRCADARHGRCVRCSSRRKACGKKCCPRGQSCCDAARGLCCPSGHDCCLPAGAAERHTCCPPGRPCLREGGKLTCCPADRAAPETATGRNVCCAADEEAVADPRGRGWKICCPSGEQAYPTNRESPVCCTPGRFAEQTEYGANVCCPPHQRALADPRFPGRKMCCDAGSAVRPDEIDGVTSVCCPPARQRPDGLCAR